MSKTRQNTEKVPITAADMERFHKNAPAALKRRQGTFVFDEFGAGLRSVFVGGVPLVGLLWGDWSSLQLLLFLLVGSWVGILCDFAKMWQLQKAILEWGQAFYEDWHVWVVVDALRVGETQAAPTYLRAKYEPWSGVFIDFACGGIATVMICMGLIRSPSSVDWSDLNQGNVLLWLVGVTIYQVVFTVWEIVEYKSNRTPARKVKVAVGLRGVGLFLFMFLLVAVTDGFEQSGPGVQRAMMAVNAAIVVWGIFTMTGPLLLLRKETAWLKNYMMNRNK
jgi:hypothetical protein